MVVVCQLGCYNFCLLWKQEEDCTENIAPNGMQNFGGINERNFCLKCNRFFHVLWSRQPSLSSCSKRFTCTIKNSSCAVNSGQYGPCNQWFKPWIFSRNNTVFKFSILASVKAPKSECYIAVWWAVFVRKNLWNWTPKINRH